MWTVKLQLTRKVYPHPNEWPPPPTLSSNHTSEWHTLQWHMPLISSVKQYWWMTISNAACHWPLSAKGYCEKTLSNPSHPRLSVKWYWDTALFNPIWMHHWSPSNSAETRPSCNQKCHWPPDLSVVEVVLQLGKELPLTASFHQTVEGNQILPTQLGLGLQRTATVKQFG